MQKRLRVAVPELYAAGQAGGFRVRAAFLTLTYRPGVEWEPHHISTFCNRVRDYCRRAGFVYRAAWVAELQKRGAVHYHFLIILPKGRTLPKPDKRGWWPHGLTKIEWARSGVGYLLKYASKGDDAAAFPRGLRICAVCGLNECQRDFCAWSMLPRYVQERGGYWFLWSRRPGGGFVSRATGEHIETPYLVKVGWSPSLKCRVTYIYLKKEIENGKTACED